MHDINKSILNSELVASPFNYTGGKYKLLHQILPLFPVVDCFFDVFCGGANVGINALAKQIILNDKNKHIIELLSYIKNNTAQDIIDRTNQIIQQFRLSQSSQNGYTFYHCESSKGLSKYNKNQFIQLRNAYNVHKDISLLYTLIVFSFNNQIRFNKHNNFNLPVGKRDFNLKMQQKLINFNKKINTLHVTLSTQDFRDIQLESLPKNTLIYCDPPYLITLAGYNEQNGWTEQDEIHLLQFLEQCNALGLRFALSNVLQAKNIENTILIDWISKHNYYCYHLKKDYSNSNYQRKNKNTPSTEVLITNYI